MSNIRIKTSKALKQLSRGQATLNNVRNNFNLESIDDKLMNKKFTKFKEDK